MPSSRPNAVPVVVHVVKQLRPQSVLDVGVGFGKWGHLFREYTDIIASEEDPARYHRENWRVIIDGVEGFPRYLTEMHRYLYNRIYEGDVRSCLDQVGQYDLIFLGDIIEHLDKADGVRLISELIKKANKAVVISTPKYDTGQESRCDNELERHRSVWTAKEFLQFPNSRVATVTRSLLIAAICPPGVKPPLLKPEYAGLPQTLPRRIWRKAHRILRRR